MVETADLELVSQLIDNMIVLSGKLDECYNKNDTEEFARVKKEILDIQKKIERLID